MKDDHLKGFKSEFVFVSTAKAWHVHALKSWKYGTSSSADYFYRLLDS